MRPMFKASTWAWLTTVFCAALLAGPATAEPTEIRVAQQFGVNYLPLLIMKRQRLIEKHAQALNLGNVKVTWAQFGSGAAMNDALLAGSLDFASGGVGPLLKIWDKANGAVKGVASLGSMPLYLTTNNPLVHTIADFSNQDRIALPAVKVSIQAIVLQMAAAKTFGDTQFDKLDSLTVSMKHPDAMAALLSRTEVTAHFGNAPFQEQELANKSVHRVLSSYDVLGRSTLNSLYTTAKFHDANPKAYRAVLAALQEAVTVISRDKMTAARVYIEEEQSKLALGVVQKILDDPDFVVTVAPEGVMKYAEFMYRTKSIGHLPQSWKDIYFPEIHNESGS